MRPIYLCGFMGCGKTTAGKLLAEKLGCGFFDMDNYITEKEKMEIPRIFAEKGEKYFREAETEAVRELAGQSGVIACGGGAMLKKENAEIASAAGTVIYIDGPFETCYSRISGDKNRPIVMNNTKEELEIIYSGRAPVYSRNASLTISGDGSAEEIADKIISAIE